jgi:DNA polymerase-3 subunit epsilon
VASIASSRWARWIGLADRRAATVVAAVADTATSPGVDPGTPLFEVPFAVVDVETTGGSPATAALTEIAAARFRGGECVGTFQTLVDPGCDVPALISLLTGITDDMVAGAPPVSSVLPSFLEFVRGEVLVGHNVSFDVRFLDAALTGGTRPPLDNTIVDTLALARRLVRPDVPNCRLRTLAVELGLEHVPSHRALDDVLATADLLHLLIERATGYGVYVLGDLVDLMCRPAPRQARVS